MPVWTKSTKIFLTLAFNWVLIFSFRSNGVDAMEYGLWSKLIFHRIL